MGKVRDLLRVKGNKVFSVDSTTTVYTAIELMCERNIGGLLVVDDNKLCGIFTERDYARKLILKGRSSKETCMKEIMTSTLITVSTDTTVDECMSLMTNHHIRHLPVLDDGELVGLVSIGDVVRFTIDEQKDIIEHLESYITGHAVE